MQNIFNFLLRENFRFGRCLKALHKKIRNRKEVNYE